MPVSSSYILFLPSWYPNKLSPFDGDFIQRHAQAVSLFCDVHVLYVVKDIEGLITKDIHREEHIKDRLKETIVYYHVPRHLGLLSGLLSLLKRKRLYRSLISEVIKNKDAPDLMHVHIAMKSGLAALDAKRKFAIPYVLTEQWTGYLPEADDLYKKRSWWFRYCTRKVIAGASAITTVSHVLGRAMQNYFPWMNYSVVPNVVNDKIFYPGSPKHAARLKLLHISNLRPQKHPKLLLEGLAMLRGKGIDFTMEIFGEKNEDVIILAGLLGLQENVFFKGEAPQEILADALREADALVFYSAYETFGCVIIEANACGVPVIVSDIPVFHELVKEGENGIFAEVGSAEALCVALEKLNQTKQLFSQMDIVSSTIQYNYQNVGQQFYELYRKILEN